MFTQMNLYESVGRPDITFMIRCGQAKSLIRSARGSYIINLILLGVCLLCLLGTVPAVAYDTAPRISDREIIEAQIELKQGQKALNQRMDDMNQSINQRFDDMNQSINQRFDNMNQSINQRFDSMDKRFEEMHRLILTMFASVMALVVGLICYTIWDRKTAQLPFKNQLHHLKNDLSTVETQLEMTNPSGPITARLLASFRKLAETDVKVAEILRSFSLL